MSAVAALAVAATGCAGPGGPAAVSAVRVELPAGARAEVIAADGDDVLIGVHRDGAATTPGLVRLGGGGSGGGSGDGSGTVTTVPATPATGYGRTASWYSLVVDGSRITAIGGDRGGAHGNVRWSVWTGTGSGVAEQIQAFTTFGGWGAGDLIDAVPTPAGPVVVGSWQSDGAGLDVATWATDGVTWTRRSSTGTALASTRTDLGSALHATAATPGVLVVGWELATARGGDQAPVVWRSATGADGWTRTPLPGVDAPGTAVSAACSATVCAVAGRVGGMLALWRQVGGTWARVPGVPAVAVGDNDPLPAPLLTPDGLTQVVPDAGRVELLDVTAGGVTARPVAGPAGVVTAAVATEGAIHLLAGPDRDHLTLWRVGAS